MQKIILYKIVSYVLVNYEGFLVYQQKKMRTSFKRGNDANIVQIGVAETGVGRGVWAPLDLRRSINPIQTKGADYAHHITLLI